MSSYTIENQTFSGPYEEYLKVVKNAFSLKDILNPYVISMIPKEYDIRKKLTNFYYSCDCQCFYCFSSEDDDKTSIFIYADTNEWEAVYIPNDKTKILLDFNGETIEIKKYDKNVEQYIVENEITNENINTIDWKWLEDIEMVIVKNA